MAAGLRVAFVLRLVFICWFVPSLPAQSLHSILTNGPNSNRFNIVFLSEGYTASQIGQFHVDTTNAMNALFLRRPFSDYRTYFNVYAIAVSSVQPGSDHPAYATYRNTYFNSSYDAISDRLITIPPDTFDADYRHGQGRVDALLQSLMPEYELAMLLVNDLTPGGSDTGGATAITYRGAGLIDFLAHEVGHVSANLGDEYVEPYPGYPDTEEPNTTRQTNVVKWAAWIPPGIPVPTPPTSDFSSVVGVFEGAHYHVTGWYRPKLDCTMNHPTFPDYCEVCRQALVLSFYRTLRPVNASRPAGTNVLMTSGLPQTFDLDLLEPPNHTLSIQWFANGLSVSGATNASYTASPQALGNGTHLLSAEVHDPTPLVRTDPSNLLTQTVAWRLQVILPELRLDSPMLMADGQFIFRVAGVAPTGFILQSTRDLNAWQSISTNSLSDGQCWFTNPPPLAEERYYRAAPR